MPEKATTEFWKDLPPIAQVFKPHALPEHFVANAPTEDERYYVPFNETIYSRPLFISPQANKWCDVLMSKGPALVSRHYDPHEVFAYTISGKWAYLEHDWTAKAGDFIYETPGESHTLVTYDCGKDWTKIFFVVQGPLIWIDEQGNSTGYFDVHDYIALCEGHYEKVGLGKDYLRSLFR
jgi:2,4'-dihydroxyacetophenone dioxygenase